MVFDWVAAYSALQEIEDAQPDHILAYSDAVSDILGAVLASDVGGSVNGGGREL